MWRLGSLGKDGMKDERRSVIREGLRVSRGAAGVLLPGRDGTETGARVIAKWLVMVTESHAF
jgi:hypothetical protein